MAKAGFGPPTSSLLRRRRTWESAIAMYTSNIVAPEALTKNENTTLGENVATKTPLTPAALASSKARAGTRRLLVLTRERGASPLSAMENNTREET